MEEMKEGHYGHNGNSTFFSNVESMFVVNVPMKILSGWRWCNAVEDKITTAPDKLPL